MACCPPTRVDPVFEQTSDYTPAGEMLHLQKLQLYRVGQGTKGVILIADIFGMNSGRHKAIADQLALADFFVLVPDFFHGQSLKMPDLSTPRLGEFISSFPPQTLKPEFDEVRLYMTAQGVKSVALMGFCWGCWALTAMAGLHLDYDCAVHCHPSLTIEENFFHRSLETFILGLDKPQLVCAASDDPDAVQPDGQFSSLLKAKGVSCNMLTFTSNHGFVTQGDLANEQIKSDLKTVLQVTISFLQKHL
eukprot:NODE_4423_length_790_cov_8.179487_g4264_i0.p1 GENE.NODE_4423_length_790_cov_8.179487_g4264_i0~~NODE_4423_length_790_cov_8.179487_g4264_i0.p1  ORF type:complete len:262 (+),score=43.57 NODE_4423_length_790_cov_8.179487_g4264_i0:45-788(+)